MADLNELNDAMETEVEKVDDVDIIYLDPEEDEDGGSGILSLLIAGAIGAGVTYGVTKVIPKIKAKKLEHDKKKLSKLQAKIDKSELEIEDVDESDLTPLTDEEIAEIEEVKEEVKTSKKKK